MELKRDIYKKLLEWKQDDSGKVMLVSGARNLEHNYEDKYERED